MKPRVKEGLLLVIFLAAAAFTAVSYGKHRETEGRIAVYCRDTSPGETVRQSIRRAIERKLVAEAHEASRWNPPILAVGSTYWLALSLCTLRHDGQRITTVSYDPWYH